MPLTENRADEADEKDRLLDAVTAASPERMAEAISDVHPALLADVLEAMPPERRLEVWSAGKR